MRCDLRRALRVAAAPAAGVGCALRRLRPGASVFVVWLIGLALAVAGPVLCVLALGRIADPATRPGAVLALAGGACGAVCGFFFSTLVEFVAERRVDTLNDAWWAAVSAGFTLGVVAGVLLHAARVARVRIEDGIDRLDGAPADVGRTVDRLPR